MESIDKPTVHILASLLHDAGVRDVVVSSGTRCAPLTVVFGRSGLFTLHPVVDERTAAFVGLGMALATDRPIALVCTSGSAPLNYAPALSEAYYRRVPLIAVSADRPRRWLGQREGQTIRQAGCLDAVVRCSVDLPPDDGTRKTLDKATDDIGRALAAATGIIKGPAHINVQIDTPIISFTEHTPCPVSHEFATPVLTSDVSAFASLGLPQSPRTLIVAGGVRLNEAERSRLSRIALGGNAVVVAEVQTNIPGAMLPAEFDRHLTNAPVPEVVGIIGGDFVSGRFKQWLRTVAPQVKFFISCTPEDGEVATFGRIDANIPCDAAAFAEFLDGIADPEYRRSWESFIERIPEVKAPVIDILQALVDRFPSGDLHIGNGSAIRYAQHLRLLPDVTVECNRGVSGIDGCTSTAVGSAMVSRRPTLFVSGDMSAAYDIGALAVDGIPPTFRMAVIDNRGGDIFRNIPTTRTLDELEQYFAMPPRFPLRQLAEAYGFAYFECSEATDSTIAEFMDYPGKAILRIITDINNNKNLI